MYLRSGKYGFNYDIIFISQKQVRNGIYFKTRKDNTWSIWHGVADIFSL